MQLSKPDFEAIKNGTAHTPDAPIECSSLIRMTKDDLSAAMGRKMPTILQKRDRRVLADCLELKERIKTRSDAKGVFAAAMKLKNGNPLPFHAVETNIQTRLFRELLSDKGADGLNLEIIEDCVNFRSPLSVFSEHPSFRRFYGGGGRDILGMNGMLSYWLENRYEEAVKYLSVIADATAYALSTERRDSEECLPIDERWLGELKGWMDVIFVYQGSSYSYELVGSPDAKVSKSVFMAVTALLGLHLPEKRKPYAFKNALAVWKYRGYWPLPPRFRTDVRYRSRI
jgi:hypothetical protein